MINYIYFASLLRINSCFIRLLLNFSYVYDPVNISISNDCSGRELLIKCIIFPSRNLPVNKLAVLTVTFLPSTFFLFFNCAVNFHNVKILMWLSAHQHSRNYWTTAEFIESCTSHFLRFKKDDRYMPYLLKKNLKVVSK